MNVKFNRTKSTLAMFACSLLASTVVQAAEVTYDRILNPEPGNWLTHHHDFSAQRYSTLDTINKTNIKNLKLAFAVPLGGKSAGESLEATPLVEDGFMYMVDSWGVVYKIDVRSGTAGRIIWKMDPKLDRQDRNRGVALWGDLVISVTGYAGHVIATNKDTGQVTWDKNVTDQADLELTAAPLAIKDVVLIGGSGGDRGVRNWVAALDPKTGDVVWKTYSIPAPGEPGSETWKDKVNAWQTGAAHSMAPALTILPAISLTGVPAIPCRHMTQASAPAIISIRRARLHSTPQTARSPGGTNTRRTTTAITMRPAPTF
jgi:alcohol dehydrogenase (cytochrome c)